MNRGMKRLVVVVALMGAGMGVLGCTEQTGTRDVEFNVAAATAAGSFTPMTGVLTQHNDLSRTGANLNETILNTSNVHTGTFGKVHSYPVTGQVYAQPLYVAQAISGKNVVYIATEANNVYAFNADSPWDLIWSRTSIETPWMSGSTCVNTQPLIGISSTPVIDPSTNTMYLTAKRNANGVFKYMLHALDLTTGADKTGSPIDMGLDATGQPLSVNGSGDGNTSGKIVFDPQRHQNRVALTLSQGVLTVGFASHCDQNNYHGWVLRFDTTASPIRPLTPYMTNPNTGHGGLWQGGGGFPVDASGNLYMVSGDGRSGTTNTNGTQLANAFIKLTNVGIAGTPTVGSWFMPSDVAALDNGDSDIGSSGPLLIPGTSLLTAGGKNGIMYVVNTTGDSMGHFVAGTPPDTQIVQRFSASSTNGQIVGGPAWWESPAGPRLYVWPGGSTLGAFAFNRSTNLFNTTAVARGPDTATGGDPQGGQVSVSANGSTAGTGIVWATRALGSTGGGGFNSNTPVGGALYAYNAENVASKLWDSTMVAADKLANAPKYITPTIANGKVYVGTLGAAPSSGGEVAVYGLLNPSDGGAGGSGGSTGTGGSGGADAGTPPTLTCATVDGGAPQPTSWTYVYNTYFAGTTTGSTAGHCSECHASALAGFTCGADKDSCYTGLVGAGQITPASPGTSPMADPERSPLAWFGRPTPPPGVLAFMPTDLVVRNPPAVAAVCGWVQAGARDDKSNGQTCSAANECASGFCPAGVCCANASCTAATYQIDTGSTTATAPFTADQFSSGGSTRTVTNTITITGITNPAPQAVYQSERYGNSTYTLPSLTPSAQYTVRLHFAELFQTAAGKRVFNVAINGTTVLTNFDIFAAAGAAFKAVLREFTATANASGQIVITFTTVTDNATIEGIELVPLSANAAPTIATAASASPNPVTGTATTLSVLGADDGGEANLTYTWATTGTPPAAVTFSANGTNAAKSSTASFTKAGSYTFQVTVKDQGNLTVTSSVAVTVNQTLTSIVVAPASATIAPSATQQFTATGRDQFAAALSVQPPFTWTASGGSISTSGLYTAPATAGGPFTVSAQNGSVTGTASVTVATGNAAPTIATAAAASPSPVTGSTTALSVLGADDGGEANLTYTWATTGTPPAAVTFSANGTNAAKASTATFTKAGSYALQVTVKDQGNLTTTSAVSVTVNQTLTSIVVSPASATVATAGTQQFTASARDQFATALTAQPAMTWSVTGGGTINSSGLFTAGATAGGPFTVRATSGSVSGTASVTVSSTPTTIYRIDSGSSSAVSPFTADQFFSGGSTRSVTNAINTTGLTNAAPQAVYQTERFGNVTYTMPSLVAGASYTVRLHFAELFWTATGKRKFNVAINGTTVLSNFDIFATTGAEFKATLREFTTTANASGQIVITTTTVTDNATVEGIEIIKQ
ncbi:MAG TPA: malectin domain-containing carbohydrate-binding protein [Polyangia bacterium]|nr:malectin domain-containing carbohydrate-binding protein [Polyangia bacterium]